MYPDMSKRMSGTPMMRASCRASSVFPTPVGALKRKLPLGFVGLPRPLRASRIADARASGAAALAVRQRGASGGAPGSVGPPRREPVRRVPRAAARRARAKPHADPGDDEDPAGLLPRRRGGARRALRALNQELWRRERRTP